MCDGNSSRVYNNPCYVSDDISKVGEMEEEYLNIAEEAFKEAVNIARSEDGWTVQKEDKDVRVEMKEDSKGTKIYRCSAKVPMPGKTVIDTIRNAEKLIPRIYTNTEARVLKKLSDDVAISYQITTDAAGGMVSAREFIFWSQEGDEGEQFIMGGKSVEFEKGLMSSKRAINGPGWQMVTPCPGDATSCIFMWLMDCEYKGMMLQSILDIALPTTQKSFLEYIKKLGAGEEGKDVIVNKSKVVVIKVKKRDGSTVKTNDLPNELIRNISEWIGTLTSSAVTMLDDDGMKIDANHNRVGILEVADQDQHIKQIDVVARCQPCTVGPITPPMVAIKSEVIEALTEDLLDDEALPTCPAGDENEVSYTRPPKKAKTSSTNKSANVNDNSSQESSETSAAAANATIDVGITSEGTEQFVTFEGKSRILNYGGFTWKEQGRKVGSKKIQKYKCDKCLALMVGRKTTRSEFSGKFKLVWKVQFVGLHTCN